MKNPLRGLLLLLVAVCCIACRSNTSATSDTNSSQTINKTATLYFAGGCFWGTEHYFKQIRGVLSTKVGYANGNIEHPTYEQVCSKTTGFAEAVEVTYNPEVLPLTLLVQLYFRSIDPTSINRQGGDIGTQYRTGIYYTDPDTRPFLIAERTKLAQAIGKNVAVEIEPLRNFYAAEDYHQDYLDKNPGGYCHVAPALFAEARRANADTTQHKYERPSTDTLKSKLTEIQYQVTQNAHAAHRGAQQQRQCSPRSRLQRWSQRKGRFALLHQQCFPAFRPSSRDGKTRLWRLPPLVGNTQGSTTLKAPRKEKKRGR